jgi:hypothetical protein
MGPDPSFQCDLETQLSWAPETTAKKMAPACVAPEPLVPPKGTNRSWSEWWSLASKSCLHCGVCRLLRAA